MSEKVASSRFRSGKSSKGCWVSENVRIADIDRNSDKGGVRKQF